MGFEFLDRVRKTSVATGLVVSLIVWLYFGPRTAGAFALGCAWSLVNLHVLRVLVRLASTDPERYRSKIAAVMFLKVPVLYGVAYLVVRIAGLPLVGFLAGFAWPLSVIALKAGGRLVLGLDRGESPGAGPSSPGADGGK